MFTGIIRSIALIDSLSEANGIKNLVIAFDSTFLSGLETGASLSVDGVCLTVTSLLPENRATFDVIFQSLNVTTLDRLEEGDSVNVERAAMYGDEIGGHLLSGHIDFNTPIKEITLIDNNYRLRLFLPKLWEKYIFSRGYVALNGASLTVSDVNPSENWFEVWLIPETIRATTFIKKRVMDRVNVEIERSTQVIVDTIRSKISEDLGPLLPAVEKFLSETCQYPGFTGQKVTESLRASRKSNGAKDD